MKQFSLFVKPLGKLLYQIAAVILSFSICTQTSFAEDVFSTLDENLKASTDPLAPSLYLPVRPIFDLEKRRIGIKVSHAAMGQIVGGMQKYLKNTKYNENQVHDFSYTPLDKGIRLDFSYQERTFTDGIGGGRIKTGESNWDIAGTLSGLHFDKQGNLLYTPAFVVKDANSSGLNVATREFIIGEVVGFVTEAFGSRLTVSQAFLNFGTLLFNFNSVFNESKLNVTPLINQLKEKNIDLNYVAIDQYGLSLGGTFSDQLIDKQLDTMTDLLVDLIVNSMKDSNLSARKDLVEILRNRIRDNLAKQIPGYTLPAGEVDQSINLIASGKSSYKKEVARLASLPLRTNPLSISVRMQGKTSSSIHNTVAAKIIGGEAPLRFEIVKAPSTYAYFSFEESSGNFLFQPNEYYTSQSFTYRVTDSLNQKAEGTVYISFDHSQIYPGHPAISQPNQPPVVFPTAIESTYRLASVETGDTRYVTSQSIPSTDKLVVKGGTLDLEADAFVSDANEDTGNLDCSIEWLDKNGKTVSRKNNGDARHNFFLQEKVPVSSLKPFVDTLFRMVCTLPNMPISVHDITVQYWPEYPALKDRVDGKKSYQYINDLGAVLTLTYNAAESGANNPAYSYKIENTSCGTQTGSLILSNTSSEIIVDFEHAAVYPSGSVNQLVWLNAPLCGKVSSIVWKLQGGNAGLSSCNLNAYPTKDAMTQAKPSSFDADMNQCGKAIPAADWSCSWVSADKTWIIPGLKSVVFTADRWGVTKYNIFSFETVRKSGCVDPESFLQPQSTSCDLPKKGYKTTDSTGNVKPSTFTSDMATCGSKVKAADWSCRWVVAEETWVIPAARTVIFTAKAWGTNKYNAFSFDTVINQGCKNPSSFVGSR